MTTQPTKRPRNYALDFTKGVLVLTMVFYHWLNYFIGPDFDYRYLRFLTPSFIFITGFVISHVYFSQGSGDVTRLSSRLLTRGLKLLLVLVALNVGRAAVTPALPSGNIATAPLSAFDVLSVLILGPSWSGPKVISFYILVPISYVLMLSALLALLHRWWRYVFHAVSVLFIVGIVLLLYLDDLRSPNLEYVTIGLLGAVAGFVPIERINGMVRHIYLVGLAYTFYLIAITIWNVPFGLLVIGVCLTVAGIYFVGLQEGGSRIRGHVILLGQYSLFGYVAQIAILQVLSASLRSVTFRNGVIVLSLVAAFALTMATVEAVDRLRTRWLFVDRAYRAAFA
jgi:hypothetical protein